MKELHDWRRREAQNGSQGAREHDQVERTVTWVLMLALIVAPEA
jgi:hypothetical protein